MEVSTIKACKSNEDKYSEAWHPYPVKPPSPAHFILATPQYVLTDHQKISWQPVGQNNWPRQTAGQLPPRDLLRKTGLISLPG